MINELKTALDKAITHMKSRFSGLQAGKASPNMVDEIQAESYGSMMPIKQIANVSCPDAKTIRIEPWDKSAVGAIEKAIQTSDLGINPQNMGDYVLLPIPPMTEDRRRQLVKTVKEETEHAHVSVRNARADARSKVKRQKDNKEISDDEAKGLEDDIQKETDQANKTIDELAKTKEQEVMTV